MSPHTDTLDQTEALGRPMLAALLLHLGVAGAVIGFNFIGHRPVVQWGDPLGGGPGSVSVTPVSKIPLPSRGGDVNPLANDTKSYVPEPPAAKTKPAPSVKAPDPNAIALKGHAAKPSRVASSPNKLRDLRKDQSNQLYTQGGKALASPMEGVIGGGGVNVGNNSPFGQQFGWYVNLLREQIGRAWKQSDIDPRIRTAPAVIVNFTIRRDGSLAQGSVRIVQRSGVQALDYSAQRAVYDAAPFRALPAGFNHDEATVEFWFELRR